MKEFIFDLKNDGGWKVKIYLKGEKDTILFDEFAPYFYLKTPNLGIKKEIETMPEVAGVEEVVKKEENKTIRVLKILTKSPGDVIKLRKDLAELGEPREADIPYAFRYLIDRNIKPMMWYDVKGSEFKDTKQEKHVLKACAFDIEVNNKRGPAVDPKKDEVLVIGYADDKKVRSFYWHEGKSNEKEIILDFLNEVKKKDPDVIIGYNSAGFDVPYLKKRSTVLGIDFDLSRDGSGIIIKPTMMGHRADFFGRLHLDAFDGVSFLSSIGAMNLPKNELEAVYKEMFGKEKIDINTAMLWKMWEEGGKQRETVIEYNKQDTIAAFEIGKEFLPLFIELSKITGIPIYEVSRMSTSQMIEWMLVREAFKQNILVPNTPSEEEVKHRMMRPIKGAYVKTPKEGLHEKIVVCDFRSLYPSLIITYNIDKTTLTNDCSNAFKSPAGHCFSKEKQGLLPKLLKELVETRAKIKKEMKKLKPGTREYKALHYRQWALKIIANSAYGYLGYARAKWYCREAAESVTAWGREYVQETAKKAEEEGFEVIYGDTDSIFIKLGEKTKEDAFKFIEKVNKNLPKGMELEFQGYYKRGLFVTKREGGAAKKKYALIREDGTVEIKGFELVRRDWSKIARETQEKVIKAVLEEGEPEKAVKIVKETIQALRNHEIKTEDLIIYTQVRRAVNKYEQQAPHVKAAKKLINVGFKVKAGSVLEYVIVKGRGSISDRAIPIQLLKENQEYDEEYYINNQVLPAAMKILRELGVKETNLKYKGTQEGLTKWF